MSVRSSSSLSNTQSFLKTKSLVPTTYRKKMKSYAILKRHCKYIFYAGSGNFWYEDAVVGDDSTILYRLFQIVLFSMYFLMTILEVMAAVYGDFPKDEKSDSVTFAVSHTIVMIKIFSVFRNKNLIKMLNKKMVKVCDEYEDKVLMAKKYRTIQVNILAYFSAVYGTMLFFIAEGMRKWVSGGHFVTVVTYYPPYDDNSLVAIAFRLFMTLVIIAMLMTMMVTVDFFTMMYLIMFKYKIITLRHYLEGIRENFDEQSKTNLKLASENLKGGLVKGIDMHAELLSVCKEIDKAFGTVMALQVCQSSGSAVSLLLQIAQSKDLTLVAGIKSILFIMGLFFLLALFLCNAGEITYQASLLSDAIFYCGWHACESRRAIGRTALVAIMRAQQPLVMKAFKMLEMTYATFILVVRSTYSVFALFYAQNQ